jgi:heptose-I-phosphate ethanolaminephosphotransferase
MKHLLFRFLILFVFVCLPVVGAHYANRDLGTQTFLYFSFLCLLFLPYVMVNKLVFRKIYWLLICIVTITWSLVETGHYFQEHAPFNELALKILYESYWQELLEYTLTTVPLWAILIAIIFIMFLIIFIYKTPHRLYQFKTPQQFVIITLLSICASYYLIFANNKGDKAGFFKDEYLGNQVLNKYYKDIQMDSSTVAKKLAPFTFNTKNKIAKTYVLIIGESSSRHHFGLYNYSRNTTPHLAKRNDITIFTDVISSNTSTIECLSKCLTMKNETENVHDFSCINIIDVAKQCGFSTYWLSNQAKEGILHNSITVGTSRANHIYFASDDKNINPKEKYDQVLLPQLQKALTDTANNKLIILHLMGTHFQYKNRYPTTFNTFTTTKLLKNKFPFADNNTKLQTINEYDNAVLYNDFLIDSILQMLTPIHNASAIYFSDHGEELYDYRNFLGHTPQGGNPWLHDVPFITWRIADSALLNKNNPYQLNRFFYTLCDWMQISSTNFAPQESLFSPALITKPRSLSNGTLYKSIYP